MKPYSVSLLCLIVYLHYMGINAAEEMGNFSLVDRALANPKIIDGHIKCLLDEGPCTTNQNIVKTALPEVILRNCRNCSPQQAQNAQKLTNFLQTRYPDVWAMLIRKYRGV